MTTHHQGKEMTENNAAQAAEQDPLSDEYVNAVIRQHGYDSPETVIARLWQWIGLNGGENSVTLLMYEAHKALSKLRAEGVQAGDEEPPPIIPDDEEIAGACINASDIDGIAYDGPSFERGYRAALASAPVADTLPLEKALYELVDKIAPGLDTGNLVQDARQASTLLGVIMASAPVAGEAQPVAYRAWFDQDNGARWLFTLWPEEERLDVQWQPLYAAPQASEAVRLDAPAQVGGVRFGKGIHWSTVISAAQRHHAFMNTPEKEAERIARAKEFVESIQADKDGAQSPANRPESRASIESKGGALDGGEQLSGISGELDCAKGAGDVQQKYWLCCGSKDPNHPNRRAPDCFNADRAKWGTAGQHSAAQKQGDSDA
ncbi:hypothetical protein KYT87_09305 [Achromobacter sp. ES-001]|uniref:hypothetical protein n=1 Tax=Achromobacter sp. ES-001 TaxID=2860286 RepID=UPI001C63EF5A|nr:hypothetical protein [Achromobacter sp. ES-001]QYJ23390.1 hypothetical protein KYT87_09305 [Achromobacter sp. ES-001]